MAKKRHSCGIRACFHGAFLSRDNAQRKADSIKGAAVIKRRIRRRVRYVVITGK